MKNCINFALMATFSTSHTCHTWRISDSSTYNMRRHMKFLHMWRNFQFPHNCHTWKAEISPHDNFFSTNISWYLWSVQTMLVFVVKVDKVAPGERRLGLPPLSAPSWPHHGEYTLYRLWSCNHYYYDSLIFGSLLGNNMVLFRCQNWNFKETWKSHLLELST